MWGKLLNMTDSSGDAQIGPKNPFLYRGYYYDSETGLYYLNSRYYDPQTGRFISADDTSTLQASQGDLLSTNLFAYCGNNPVVRVDVDGQFWMLIGAIGGAVVGAAAGAIISYAATEKVNWWAVGGGAVAGALIGCGAGYLADKAVMASSLAAASTGVYATWQQAEQGLRNAMGSVQAAAQRTFSTPFGSRIADAFNVGKRLLGESKYGYQSLSQFMKNEIAKDSYLMQQGYKVEWHFYWSQVSNSGGPSGPLRQALQAAGIKIIEHFTR